MNRPITREERSHILKSGLFDPEWYALQYPDVKMSGIDPLEHFIFYGSRLGRKGTKGDVEPVDGAAGAQLLERLLRSGKIPDGRSPLANAFDRRAQSDTPANRIDGRAAFLQLGEHTSAVSGPALEIGPGSIADIAFAGTLAIHLHLFHIEMLAEMRSWMVSIPVPFDLYVSVASEHNVRIAEQGFENIACLNRIVVETFDNRGRDIGPMIAGFGRRLAQYDVVGHLHSKRSEHTPGKKDWGVQLGHSLFHSPDCTAQILSQFASRADLGIVFPAYHPSVKGQIKWGANLAIASRELARLVGGAALQESELLPFPAGSFFLARVDAIRPLLEADFSFEDFEEEAGQVDGTLAHAIERLFVIIIGRLGYGFLQVAPTRPHSLGRSYLEDANRYSSEFLDRVRQGKSVTLPVHSRSALKGLRIRFFTCSTAGYDEPLPWEAFVEGADHHFYSDQDGPREQAQWQIHPLAFRHENPVKTARRHKSQPHHILEDVDIAIWVDGNICVTGDVAGLIAKVLEHDAAFGVIPHPYRASVSEELGLLSIRSIDDPGVMQAQFETYLKQGFPDDDGLTETNFLVMDLRRPETRRALDIWWSEIEHGSRRDQLSFDYACWKAGAKKVPLISNGLSVRADPRFAYFSHGGKSHPGLDLRQRLADIWNNREPAPDPERHRRSALSVDVVVCVHNSPDDVSRCLRSLALNRDARTRIVIVDDGSMAPTRQVIARHLAANTADLLVRHDAAQGYTKAANAGMRASNADYVVLLNSDTIVPADWVGALVEAGESDPDVGIIGPLSNAASWQSVPETMVGNDLAVNNLPDGLSVDDVGRIYSRLPADKVYRCPVLNGFCFAIKRRVIDTIGYLDEEAFPQGYGEENDYCLRLRPHGMTCGFTLSTYIYHAKSKSFNHERRRKLSEEGWHALVRKYSQPELAAVVAEMKSHPALAMARRWYCSQTKRVEPGSRAIGFYLPQFHSFPFNDDAWGPGFSEWRNVVKAGPRFDGHVQPLLPGELGFYDLRTRETLAKQARLAALHGLYGMAVYYYRFGRERLMSAPTDLLLASPGINLRFFYCWANEDWTRAWDGKTDDILLKQDYSDETLRLLVDDLAEACADGRYIRIDDRPVLMIYQLNRLPDAVRTIARIRELAVERLTTEPIIGTTWNPEFRDEWEAVVDFVVQFPPHRTPRISQRTLLPRTKVPGASEETADHLESYDHVIEQSLEAMDVYDRLAPGVCPAWDNSPRRARQANILIGSTPDKFGQWVSTASQKAMAKHDAGKIPAPFLFVNAWNEWAEGAVMEPTERDGRAYLRAFQRAII